MIPVSILFTVMRVLLLICCLFPASLVFSQQEEVRYQLLFYNVENLFYPEDDPLTSDDAFTPGGANRWTYKRYFKKIYNIAKVIIAAGEGSPPDIIGMAEIENSTALRHLCRESPLKKYNYEFIHHDSPDNRGIDVALLYRSGKLSVIYHEAIPVLFPFDSGSKNRDILHVVIKTPEADTLHLFVNHWTSRYGGYSATIPKRNHYARVARQKADSLLLLNPMKNIVMMGDFNDYPTDESLLKILDARKIGDLNGALFNLMHEFSQTGNIGTHKHEDFWGCLDQIIVSRSLLHDDNPIQVYQKKAHIFMPDFIFEPDEKYGGMKPFRTYLGPRYIGGYADHLPVFIVLTTVKRK